MNAFCINRKASMKKFIKVNQILLFLSFFLPFVSLSFCTKKESVDTNPDSTTVIIKSSDTLSVVDSSSSQNISDTIATETKKDSSESESLAQRLLNNSVFPEYSNCITGFGIALLGIGSLFENEIGFDIWRNLLLPISFTLSILMIFIPLKKRKLLLYLSALGLGCVLTLLPMDINKFDGLLIGFWLCLIFYALNTVLIYRLDRITSQQRSFL
jgi:hypothetical protein